MNQKSQTSQILYRHPTKAEQVPSFGEYIRADLKDSGILVLIIIAIFMAAVVLGVIVANVLG